MQVIVGYRPCAPFSLREATRFLEATDQKVCADPMTVFQGSLRCPPGCAGPFTRGIITSLWTSTSLVDSISWTGHQPSDSAALYPFQRRIRGARRKVRSGDLTRTESTKAATATLFGRRVVALTEETTSRHDTHSDFLVRSRRMYGFIPKPVRPQRQRSALDT